MIGDTIIDENIRAIVGSKLVFYKNHNLLIYFKSALTISGRIIEEIEDTSNSNSSFLKKENNLLDIENDVSKKNFY